MKGKGRWGEEPWEGDRKEERAVKEINKLVCGGEKLFQEKHQGLEERYSNWDGKQEAEGT